MEQLIEKVTQSHTTNEWHLVVTISKVYLSAVACN